jgi:hypothetical protein
VQAQVQGGEGMVHIDEEMIAALLGAMVGGVFGTIAGVLVSRWSIRYDRRLAACSAMQGLSDEARFNAEVLRHVRVHQPDYAPSGLERQAFDAALPVLHVLPIGLRDRSRDARSKILILMHIEVMLEMAQAKPGSDLIPLVQKRDHLLDTLPEELESVASDVETFVKSDCASQRF